MRNARRWITDSSLSLPQGTSRQAGRKLRVWVGARWFPIICAAVVFARLSYDDFELSYDYAFYKRFILELSYTTFSNFQTNAWENAPYYSVAIQEGFYNFYLSFEIGFAVLCFALAQIIPTSAILPILAASSIYAKILALRRFGVHMAILSGLFVFFIAMLETNALRAGISQSIAVVGLLVAARSGRLWPLLVAATIAATFHLSSLAVTLVLCGSWIFFRQFGVSVRSFRILALVTLLLGVSFSVPWIANYFSRVDVYARLEESSGSPWLKMLPLLSVILSGFAVWCSERLIRERRRQVRHTHMQRFTMPATVPVAASCAVIVFLFGTTLYVFNSMPVLSARVWQMTVPFGFLPCALAIRWRVLNPRERQIVWAVLALVACAFIYQFMFRHVLTNFFSPLIGHQDLDLGQCASGLCE